MARPFLAREIIDVVAEALRVQWPDGPRSPEDRAEFVAALEGLLIAAKWVALSSGVGGNETGVEA